MKLYVLDIYEEKFPNCGRVFNRRITSRSRGRVSRLRTQLAKASPEAEIRAYTVTCPPLDMQNFEKLVGTEDIWEVFTREPLE